MSPICKVLEIAALSSSREAAKRVSDSWLATFLTPFYNVCTSVKGLAQTKQKGCTALASKYRVFFLSSFFSLPLAWANMVMSDRSDLLSHNEPLGEKGQLQLPLATSLAAGR